MAPPEPGLTAVPLLQAAVGVVQKGLRPALPLGTPQPLANIMGQCWVREPQARPSFESLKEQLEVSRSRRLGNPTRDQMQLTYC